MTRKGQVEYGVLQTAPAAVVSALRGQILAVPDGSHLGSEAELLRRLGVSSPTLRQAARLLEQQQLLSVERGNGGGYFARRPNAGATSRAAALYLELRQTPIEQVRNASAPLMAEVSRLAAGCADPQRQAAMRAVVQSLIALPEQPDIPTLLAIDRALSGEILTMAGNPAADLFLRVIYRLGRLHDQRLQLFETFPGRAGEWRRHVIGLGTAILENDPDLAALLSRRGSAMTDAWIGALERPGLSEVDVQRLWRPTTGPATTTQVTADKLRLLILSTPDGDYLGSEEELASRFQISRHTVRQAAAIMRHHGLLEIRRGVKGGYVSRRPGIEHVVNSAATYLEMHRCTLLDLSVASTCLAAEACRLAAANPDEGAREALRATATAFDPSVLSPDDPRASEKLLSAEKWFIVTMLRLAGSEPIALFVKSMYRYGGMIHQPVYDHPDGIAIWARARVRVVEAILAGDGEAAAVIFGRIPALLRQWLE